MPSPRTILPPLVPARQEAATYAGAVASSPGSDSFEVADDPLSFTSRSAIFLPKKDESPRPSPPSPHVTGQGEPRRTLSSLAPGSASPVTAEHSKDGENGAVQTAAEQHRRTITSSLHSVRASIPWLYRWLVYCISSANKEWLSRDGDRVVLWLREGFYQWCTAMERDRRAMQPWFIYTLKALHLAATSLQQHDSPWLAYTSKVLWARVTIDMYRYELPWLRYFAGEVYYHLFPFPLFESPIEYQDTGRYWEKEEDLLGNIFRKHDVRFKRKDEELTDGRFRFFPSFYKGEAVRLTKTPKGAGVGTVDLRKLAKIGLANKMQHQHSIKGERIGEEEEGKEGEDGGEEGEETGRGKGALVSGSPNGFVIEEVAPDKPVEAIKYYTEQLRNFNPMTFPEEWAFIQYCLAVTFVESSEGVDVGCLDNAIYHLENSRQVYTPEFEPKMCAVVNQSLGRVLMHRVQLLAKSDKLEARSRLASYQYLALETFEQARKAVPAEAFPMEHAWTNMDLSKALLAKRDRDLASGPETAIDLLEHALALLHNPHFADSLRLGKTKKPKINADPKRAPIVTDPTDSTQRPGGVNEAAALALLGKAHLCRTLGTRDENVQRAVERYTKCLSMRRVSTIDWAHAHVDLAMAYSCFSTNARQENPVLRAIEHLEAAIPIFKRASEGEPDKNSTVTITTTMMDFYLERCVECHWQLGRLWVRMYKEEFKASQEGPPPCPLQENRPTSQPAPEYLPKAIKHLETAAVHARPEFSPSPHRYCSIHEDLSETYTLYAAAIGTGTDNLSAAADHLLTVAKHRSKAKAPRDWLVIAMKLAILVTAMGRLEESLVYHRQVYDTVGLLVNARRFDVLDADRNPKAPAELVVGTDGEAVDFFVHVRPYLTKGLDALLTCIFQDTAWAEHLAAATAGVVVVESEEAVPDLASRMLGALPAIGKGADKQQQRRGSVLVSANSQAVAPPSLGTRCLRCLCCWKPDYPTVVCHPLVLEGLAMLYRLGHVRFTENTARWDVDHGLRSRQLLEVQLPGGLYDKEIVPLRSKLASRLWAVNEDNFAARQWDYFRLSAADEWLWQADAVPDQSKLVERLVHLERLSWGTLAKHDALYPRLTMVPSEFPLSIKDLADSKERKLPTGSGGKTTPGGEGERKAEEGKENEEPRCEVDMMEDFLCRQLGGSNESLIVWEATTDALLAFVVYKGPPPPDGQRYEEWRLRHRSTYIKMVVIGESKMQGLATAVQNYFDILHSCRTASITDPRDRAFHSCLKDVAGIINLQQVLDLLPPHIKVLTLVPGPGSLLDCLPLHALPLTGDRPTLADRYDVRYASSLMTLNLAQRQYKDMQEKTPVFFSQLCVLEEPEVVTHGQTTPTTPSGSLECRLVELSYSATRTDIVTLSGAEVTPSRFRTIFQSYDKAPEDAKATAAPTGAGAQRGVGGRGDDDDDDDDEEEDVPGKMPVPRIMNGPSRGAGDDVMSKGSPQNYQSTNKGAAGRALPGSEASWGEVLAKCRACHIVCPVTSFPTQGLLLTSPEPFTGRDILRNLHLRHCGLVTLSRAGVCDSLYSLQQLRHGFQPFELADAFLCAGALSMVQPLWTCSDDGGLSSTLLMWKLYSCFVDVAHVERPVAAALRDAQHWLRDATCQDIKAELAAQRRVTEDVRVGIEEALWAFVVMRSGKAATVLRASSFNQQPALLASKPFEETYYWAGYRAIGACKGVHREGLGDVSDEEDDDENDEVGGRWGLGRKKRRPKFKWEEYDIKNDPKRRAKFLSTTAEAKGKNKKEKGRKRKDKAEEGMVTLKQEDGGVPGQQQRRVLSEEGNRKEIQDLFETAHPSATERAMIEWTAPQGEEGLGMAAAAGALVVKGGGSTNASPSSMSGRKLPPIVRPKKDETSTISQQGGNETIRKTINRVIPSG